MFLPDRRDQCVAVLEIVTSSVMDVVTTMADLSKTLESVGLCTCDKKIVNQLIPNRTANIALPNHVYILDRKRDGINEQQSNDNGNGNGGDIRKSSFNEESLDKNDSQDNSNGDGEHEGMNLQQENDGDDDDDDEEEEKEKEGELQKKSNKKRKRGKPGVQLSLENLQSQFGVGLKDAAARLGVCATTLKRACRRHGIQRWPRRAIQKVSRALDDMERKEGPLATAGEGGRGRGGEDSRWGVLASFIPAYHQSGDHGGATGGGGATIQQQQQQHQQQEELPDGLIIIKQHPTATASALASRMPAPPPPQQPQPQPQRQQQNQQQQLQQPQLSLPGLSMGPSLSQLSLPPLPSEFDSFDKGFMNDDGLWSVDPSMLEFLMNE